ncbi:hypothetical protein CEXT_667851 [Caerostris extrusa]|uniref:Uncharacterized protein n=1 Tax=Caerostris extrusa TaxID=172846 RepID=A0AAV4SDS0_CAEEX|nr:hypothetical protein CEXT_667851 [Caerostris extrusa]
MAAQRIGNEPNICYFFKYPISSHFRLLRKKNSSKLIPKHLIRFHESGIFTIPKIGNPNPLLQTKPLFRKVKNPSGPANRKGTAENIGGNRLLP